LTTLVAKGGDGPLQENVRIPFLNGLPTVKHSVLRDQNPVLREKRGHGAGVVLIVCLIQLQTKLTELAKCLGNPQQIALVDCLSIDSVFLLCADRNGKRNG
jgi:hypothetical protein